MEEQILSVTKLINALLGKPVLALLAALHIRPENPEYPVPNHVAMELVVFLVAIVFFTWLKGRLSVDCPGGAQQCMEALLTNSMGVGARDLLEDIAGHGAERYLPMLGSVGIFVLMSNLISLVPGFSSPTAQNFASTGRWATASISWAPHWPSPPSCCRLKSSATWRGCSRSPFVFG
jgi:F-type H+-transporting ATPase subunit a